MNKTPPASPSPGLKLGDVYHILFRHKWSILAIWTIGLLAAVAIWFAWPLKYQSQAKLLVRYVLDNKSLTPVGDGSDIQTPDRRGDSIMDSEVQILNSLDLALEVADTLGPSNILAKVGGGDNRYQAAGVIEKGLKVEAPRNSAVIFVTFEHPDPSIVQPVLRQLIASYLRMHAEVHQAAGTLDNLLTQQTDQLRTQLQQTEQDLKNAKLKVGVISLDDTKKAYAERLAKIQQDLMDAEVDLAAREASLVEMTNLVNSAHVETNAPVQLAISAAPPADKAAEYKRVCGLLDSLGKMEQNLLVQFKPDSIRVRNVQARIAANQKIKDQLENTYPQLVGTQATASSLPAQPLVTSQAMIAELTKAKSLQAKISTLNQQLAEIQKQMDAVANAEGHISDLERKQALQATNYMYLTANLEKARIDEALSSGRVSNISEIQRPTPPLKDTKKLRRALMLMVAAALAGGLALAFVIELYLDRSFKRPVEIESRLNVPLFLSIPRTHLNGKHRLEMADVHRRLLSNGADSNGTALERKRATSNEGNVAPWRQTHGLRQYFEALRDRLIMFFEMHNLTHKPKLVAVTSCAEGSGVSTISSGLAACLSETGEGNVLLVDMNTEQGTARYFHKGNLECGLDDALLAEKREDALVQDNLYLVAETVTEAHLPRVLHKRFSALLPRLKASDYDYIIFDMPPVSQISPTTRLARFMDMIFMVVEAERTDRDVVKRATDLLAESKANVGVVLNKRRTYVPKALQQEI